MFTVKMNRSSFNQVTLFALDRAVFGWPAKHPKYAFLQSCLNLLSIE
jgi:hypothetical protein